MRAWDQYDLICKLGQGKYGTVTRARHRKLGSLVALKSVVNPQQTQSVENSCIVGSGSYMNAEVNTSREHTSLYHEARVLATLSHPCLVSLVEICVGVDGLLGLALEDLGGMTLAGLVKKQRCQGLCECLIGCIINHIGEALNYLHSRGYLHRDVKPDNIMIEASNDCFPNAKLIDLGLSIQYSLDNHPNTSVSRAGTLAYMAPELMRADQQYDASIDIFSLGASAYYGLTGQEPFSGYTSATGKRTTTSVHGLQANHLDALEELPEDVAQVVCGMLEKQPAARWSVRKLLRSKWLLCCCIGRTFARSVHTCLPKLVQRLVLHQDHLPQSPPTCLTAAHHHHNIFASSSSSSSSESSYSDTSYSEQEKTGSRLGYLTSQMIPPTFTSGSCCSSPNLGQKFKRSDSTNNRTKVPDCFKDQNNRHSASLSNELVEKIEENKTTVQIFDNTSLGGICNSRNSLENVRNNSRESDVNINMSESSGDGCRVVGRRRDEVCLKAEFECACTSPVSSWQESTLEQMAKILDENTASITSVMNRQPWGEVAGIYNLLRMSERENFTSKQQCHPEHVSAPRPTPLPTDWRNITL